MAIKGCPTPRHDKDFSIDHHRDECIGCGACAAVSVNWFMEEDGKASVTLVDMESLGENKDAAESCPVNCIHLIDNRSKKKII